MGSKHLAKQIFSIATVVERRSSAAISARPLRLQLLGLTAVPGKSGLKQRR
jgi:hypothetical protein